MSYSSETNQTTNFSTPQSSRKLAKLFTKVFTDNTSNTEKRLNIITFLQTWCTNGVSHIVIDKSNYDPFVRSLNETYIDVDNCSDFERKLLQEEVDWDCSLVSEMLEYERNRIRRLRNKETKFELMHKFDQEQLQIELNVQNNYRSENFDSKEELIKDLLGVSEKKNCENQQIRNITTQSSESIHRLQQIKTAYAVLHLNRSKEDFLLLKNILNSLLNFENLIEEEYEFLSYFWANLNEFKLPEDVLCLLLKFSYLYEKPILEAAKNSLKICKFEPTQELQRIKDLCRIDLLKHTVNNLLCDLFVLSNYNRKLVRLIKFFN